MEAIDDIDTIKCLIEQHAATSSDTFVVSDEIYNRIRSAIQGSLEQYDELMDDARLSIDKVCIIPLSRFNEFCKFKDEFTDESMLLIKLLNSII